MAKTSSAYVRARMNHGRWIADCPRPYCTNAMRLTLGQITFHCAGEGGCGMHAAVAWPDSAELIQAVLEQRPVPGTRNWYPAGHPEAVRLGLPHGQSVSDLREETRQHEGVL